MTDTELDTLRQLAHAIARALDLEWARRKVAGVPIHYTRQHPDGTAGEWYVIYLRDLIKCEHYAHKLWTYIQQPTTPTEYICRVYESHAAALDDLAQAWLDVYGGDL